MVSVYLYVFIQNMLFSTYVRTYGCLKPERRSCYLTLLVIQGLQVLSRASPVCGTRL